MTQDENKQERPLEDADKTLASPGKAQAPGPRGFDHYEVLKELGRGAQGVVYLALDTRLHRKVALKMLIGAGLESLEVRERFRREAELSSKFEHAGICGVHEVGEVDGAPYIAMQYVQGSTLASILERARAGVSLDGRASETVTISPSASSKGQQLHDLIKLIELAARALHVAHEAGLVHRDVKPGNIMVTPEGAPVLLDFGMARDLGDEGKGLTQSGQIIGTPLYLAPEQISASRGNVDRRTDVYALGVVLFECLTLARPFDASTWDQLFNQILNGDSPSPRKYNPRIPQDLCTIIEVAMERDQTRRYQTAFEFAEDLRRVRAFEPIQAKAAGRLARAVKWARRNPGRATAAGAAALFAATALGVGSFQAVVKRREVRSNLATARRLMELGDLDGSRSAVARALDRDPRSPTALELEARIDRERELQQREQARSVDLEAAREARAEAEQHRARHAELAERIRALSNELLGKRGGVFGRAAPDEARRLFAERERELNRLRVESGQTLVAYEEALQRASRRELPWGEVSQATERALADYYMTRWRWALETRDEAWTSAMRAAVETHDRAGVHERELLGRGTLTVHVATPGTELFLFRYEPIAEVNPAPSIPRLAPAPTAGVGFAREGAWVEDFHPGDECLEIHAVEPDSPAARAGLRRGDLVLRVQGEPCGRAVFVRAEPAAASDASERRLARVLAVDGAPIESMYDWVMLAANAQTPSLVSLSGAAEPVELEIAREEALGPAQVARGGLDVAVRLDCLRDGERLTLNLAPREASGLDCEPTAYPLICAPDNRIEPGAALVVDPGSYLIVARAPGRMRVRHAVLVERLADAEASIDPPPESAAPPGFIYVPPGPFLAAGDQEAFQPGLAQVIDVQGFFIARKEVTNREWYAFLNDPRTRERLRLLPPDSCLPRDDRVMARIGADGQYEWDVYRYTSEDSPVLGLSWTDIREYLNWRNQQAEEAGEPWRYGLPTEAEWEKAARGVDARDFPWGNRFDPGLTVCLVRKPDYLLDAAGGFEPCDESPYGVLDMAGSREEWLIDQAPASQPPRYRKRGGRWNSYVEAVFRVASRAEASQDYANAGQGFRLVLRAP